MHGGSVLLGGSGQKARGLFAAISTTIGTTPAATAAAAATISFREHNVRPRSPRVVGNRQQSRGHHLDDPDPKVFLPHGVNADAGSKHGCPQFRIGWIDAKVHVVAQVEFFYEPAELVDPAPIGVVAATPNQQEFDRGVVVVGVVAVAVRWYFMVVPVVDCV